MPFEAHRRARLLLDQAAAGEIGREERRWLDGHVAGCAECGRYAELSARTVRALGSFAFDVDPVAALRVQAAIRSRADELAAAEARAQSLLIGTAIAALLTVAGSLAMWQPVAWLAGRWNVPSPVWQIAFAMFWLVPSVLLAALPWFRTRLADEDSGGEGETV